MSKGSFGGLRSNPDIKDKIKYVSNKDKNNNQAKRYMVTMLRNDFDKANLSGMATIIENTLSKGCIYIPNFFSKSLDFDIFNKILTELNLADQTENNNSKVNGKTNTKKVNAKDVNTLDGEIVKWSQHHKYENPTFSNTFNQIIDKMSKHFDVDVYATRMNYYKDGLDWKPFHHDSHAYVNGKDSKKTKEDFTMGASFGSSRELVFLHEESKNRFSFPQNNGDVFAFDTEVNTKFMHGVPKSKNMTGPRISIIAWGKRRVSNQ